VAFPLSPVLVILFGLSYQIEVGSNKISKVVDIAGGSFYEEFEEVGANGQSLRLFLIVFNQITPHNLSFIQVGSALNSSTLSMSHAVP